MLAPQKGGPDTLSPQHALARLAVLPEQVADEVKSPAARLLIEAIGDNTVALALPPGFQTEPQPLGDALGAGRIAVAQAELGRVSRRHDDERHVEAMRRRLELGPKPGLKSAAL